MGRRSRRRADGAPPPAPAPRVDAPRELTRRARREEAPKPPWHPVPLVELSVLLGLILIVVAFFAADGDRRGLLLVCGTALASLSGLEVAIREHFAGYRSHSALLALACAVAIVAVLFFATGLPQIVLLGVAVLVFGLAFQVLRRAFAARAGGLTFRA